MMLPFPLNSMESGYALWYALLEARGTKLGAAGFSIACVQTLALKEA